MNKTVKMVLFGFLSWLIPFMAGFAAWPLHESNEKFFKTIMLLIGGAAGALLMVLYFKAVSKDFLKEGIITGFIWLVMNIILDILVLVIVFKSTFSVWLLETGLRYLTILFSFTAVGLILQDKLEKK